MNAILGSRSDDSLLQARFPAMTVIGIDPGSSFMAAVIIRDDASDGALDFAIARGEKRPRVSKKNPAPLIRSRFYYTTLIAVDVLSFWIPWREDAIYAIEGSAFSMSGKQDALAGARQALYDSLVAQWGISRAEEKIRLVNPLSGKKALTDYNLADKQRMVSAASKEIHRLGGAHAGALFATLPKKEKEAVADALGIALAVLRFPRRKEG